MDAFSASGRSLAGKTLFITGASRGIGKAIGLRAARDGANVVIAAKTASPHPKLPGTIYTAAEEIEAAGGQALPLTVDVRSEDQVAQAVAQAVQHFGGIDVLVNNASAIFLADTEHTPAKRFDLMMAVNLRGTFLCGQACIPHLRASAGAHILTLCPPLDLRPQWFGPHLAYSISKYGMSLCVLGWAEELRPAIGVNALWPRTVIATAAVQNLLGGDEAMRRARTPEVVADAAHAVITRSGRECSGHFFLDEDVLRQEGVQDFSSYAVDPEVEPRLDLFVAPDSERRPQ